MKTKKSTLLLAVILVLSLIFTTTTAFAATRTVRYCEASFTATSDDVGSVTVYGESSGITPYITSKITLQWATIGSSIYYNADVDPETKTVKDRGSITHKCEFPIPSPIKDYRIKIELTDNTVGDDITTTYYKKLTR